MQHPQCIEVDSDYLVRDAENFKHERSPTEPPKGTPNDEKLEDELHALRRELDEQQRILYANAQYGVLLIFQGMDASGKDGTIRAVLRRIDPAGIAVTAFGPPSHEENRHDFLWRTSHDLPKRGHIAVYNRSYYEEVLITRVHPEFLKAQHIADACDVESVMKHRLQSIAAHEKHLAHNGTIIIKFWLKHSQEVQRHRFLERLTEPEKFGKFSSADIEERQYWDHYMEAYQTAIRATHQPWAPWYVVPSDNKPYQHVAVARIIRDTLTSFAKSYPKVEGERRLVLDKMREQLLA